MGIYLIGDYMKIGIPRAMFYYLNGDITVDFFRNLGVDVVISPKTNKKIVESGMKYAPDEMCLSMKNYICNFNRFKLLSFRI